MALRTARLPGISFEVVPGRREVVLPRMDVAVFVGFAASGPMHIPVPIDDIVQFIEIFGSDLPLAWDAQRGETVYAYLAPTVRAFFRNGGQRCWVIRVAGEHAYTAHLPLPGLAQVREDVLSPAYATARSPGSWADSLRVSTALSAQAVKVTQVNLEKKTLELLLDAPNQVQVGDLLRLAFGGSGALLFFYIDSVESLEKDRTILPEQTRRVSVLAKTMLWFQPANRQVPQSASAKITLFTHAGIKSEFPALVPLLDTSQPELDWPSEEQEPVHLDCWRDPDSPPAIGLAAFPPVGALVKVEDISKDVFWLSIEDIQTLPASVDSLPDQDPASVRVRLTGHGLWQLSTPPDLTNIPLEFAEKLTFELWARQEGVGLLKLSELGFSPDQPRYWGNLPTDEQLFDSSPAVAMPGLWLDSRSPRFPLAGSTSAVSVPIAIGSLPGPGASPDDLPATPLERDGVDRFSGLLFVDEDLAVCGSLDLMDRADYLRYFSETPRRLRGIYAALQVDEATLIAVPDAVQTGWSLTQYSEKIVDGNPIRRKHPDWLHYLPCEKRNQPPLKNVPDWGQFLNCGLLTLDTPELQVSQEPDETSSFSLSWNAIQITQESQHITIQYVVEEAAFPDFSGAREIYRGIDTHLDFYGYSKGTYYYHVSAEAVELPGLTSDWSNSCGVQVGSPPRWQVDDLTYYSPTPLHAVQHALLRMCAARGDLFAVLSLPASYKSHQAQAYAQDLRLPLAGTLALDLITDISVPALGYGETRALSFGALLHPWMYTAEETSSVRDQYAADESARPLRLIPPEGACLGLIARRAIEQGAWVAPANVPLRGVLALEPQIFPSDWLDLQEAHLNLVRHEPSGFICLDADTLSDDMDWRPINVRRLFSLLRRLVLRYGPTYVFEPNDQAFQSLVKRGFEGFMDYLFIRSAFAGATPETSYQVNVNVTPQDIDAGRFIVEIRVAPSLPMRFLTIRLVQSGERSLVIEGG